MIKIENHFNYRLDVEYDTDDTCRSSMCEHDFCCRCATIENARVVDFDLAIVVDVLEEKIAKSKKVPKNEIYKYREYFIDRICRILKISVDDFDVIISGGYYGEEIDGVEMCEKRFNSFVEHINAVFKCKNISNALHYVLDLEYQSDQLKDKAFSIIEASRSQIKLGNPRYGEMVKRSSYKHILDKDQPLCVCIKDGDFYRLIDGYHRFTSTDHKKFLIFAGE